MKVIDADGAVLGRMCSSVAKQLLMGEQVIIVNAEKAVVSGSAAFIKEDFLHKRQRGFFHRGPFYPKYPDMLVKRVVRGMLPYKKEKGRLALKRLKVCMGCPEKYAKGKESIGKQRSQLRCKYMSLGEVCKFMGAKPERLG